MAARHMTFHIPQEGDPDQLIPLLEAMYSEEIHFPTVSALLDFARDRGLGGRTETQILATSCGLMERDSDNRIVLSETAEAIVRLRTEIRPELVHYLLYTGWQPTSPSVNTALWSYRQVVDSLWNRAPVSVVSIANVIAEEINNYARQVFASTLAEDDDRVSFSPKSIRGVRRWLEALSPPVIDKDVFSRRHFCPPELALLATGWAARTTEGEVGLDFLLTQERREAICRLCVLDVSALDRVLDWMLPRYPSVVRPGTTAGVYGRFLRFSKWPDMADLLPFC